MNAVLDAEKSKLANLKNDYNLNIDAIKKYGQQIEELKKSKQDAISQYGEESKEVADLNKEIAKLERQHQSCVSAVDDLNIKILNQQANVNKTEKEIQKYNNQLNTLQAESTQTISASEKLNNAIAEQKKELSDLKNKYTSVVLEQGKTSDEAKQLASQIRALNGDLKENKASLNKAESAADELADSLKNVDDGATEAKGGFTILKGAIADLTANAISTAISGIKDFIGSIFDLAEATEEYRMMMAKIEGSANSFGYSTEFAKDKYAELYTYLKDDQAATNAVTNLLGLGLETKNVDSLVNSAIATWSAYGDSIPIEGLTESMAETINVSKVTGTLADTINWVSLSNAQWTSILGDGSQAQKAFNEAMSEGLPLEDAFNEALAATTSEQDRANLVASLLNETYGESKQTYDQLNSGILEANEAELKLKETQAELGQAVEPVNTLFKDFKNEALQAVQPYVEAFAQKVLDLNDYLKENPAVMQAVTALVLGLATAFGILAGALAIQGIIAGVTKAIALLNATILANPITLIVAAIAGLVAGFIYLWNTSDSFRQFWIDLWETIKNLVMAVVDGILQGFQTFWESLKSVFSSTVEFFSTIFSGAWEGIKTAFSSAVDFFSGIWENITNVFSGVKSWFSDIFSGAWEAVKNVFSSWGSFFGGLWDNIKNTFSALGTKISNAIGDSIKAGINGVISSIENIINGGITLINGAIGLINKIPGVDIGKMDLLSFPRLAKGGFATGNTLAEIGEEGKKEVVLPLERNLGWAKLLATHLLKELEGLLPQFEVPNIASELKGIIGGLTSKLKATVPNIDLPELATASNTNITFNQYNTSPKALDSLEVYRNTQKQIKQLKAWKGGK